jgi:DNA-binding IclR family transcriptional regulator
VSSAYLEKTFSVLEVMTELDSQQTLGTLAEATTLPKSTLHRILRSLTELGYVDQDCRSGAYGLTLRLARLGQSSYHESLKEMALPLMQRLHRRYNETVNLGVLQGRYVYYLHTIETNQPLRWIVSPGSRDVFHCTALGKAIAAFLPEQQRETLLLRAHLATRTEKTVTSKRRLRAALERIRVEGVAGDDEENDIGVACFGFPLLAAGYPVGAISLSLPKVRLTDVLADKIRATMRSLHGEAAPLVEELA